jgi:hypothetical protein
MQGVTCSRLTRSFPAMLCQRRSRYAISTRIGEAVARTSVVAAPTGPATGATIAAEDAMVAATGGTMTAVATIAAVDATVVEDMTTAAAMIVGVAIGIATTEGATIVAGGATIVAGDTTTGDTMTAAATTEAVATIAKADDSTTGATTGVVQTTEARVMMTLRQLLTLRHQHQHPLRLQLHQPAICSTPTSTMLALMQPLVIVTKDLTRSGRHLRPARLLAFPLLHLPTRTQCLTCSPRPLPRHHRRTSSHSSHSQLINSMRLGLHQLRLVPQC